MEKIKELRDKTGAGMVDCKNALDETGGDLEKAIEILRKKGIAKAAKRSDRKTGEGIIKVANRQDNKEGYILEVNAETDFVVRSEKFQQLADKLFALIMEQRPENLDALMSLILNDLTAGDAIKNLSGVIGEKIEVKRFDIIKTAGTVAGYSHAGGKIGVLVELDKDGQGDLARDLAMQIAAANPKYILPNDVPAEEMNKEKEIYRAQLQKEGKPEEIIVKIIGGKMDKYFEEVCLAKQEYIKDDKKRVQDILGEAQVVKFIRYSL